MHPVDPEGAFGTNMTCTSIMERQMAPPTMEAGNSVVTFNLLATPESKEIMFKFFISRFSDKNHR